MRKMVMRGGLIAAAAAMAMTAPVQAVADQSVIQPKSYVATFEVPHDVLPTEYYRVRLTDPVDITKAKAILDKTESRKQVPVGLVVRGESGVNRGYSWHIDTNEFFFGDYAEEICDSRPSWVEDGSHTYPYFCPWDAELIELAPLTSDR